MIEKIALLTALVFLLTSLSSLSLAKIGSCDPQDHIDYINEKFKDQAPLSEADFKTYFAVLPQVKKVTDRTGAKKVLAAAKIDSLRFEYIDFKISTIISLLHPNQNLTPKMMEKRINQHPEV